MSAKCIMDGCDATTLKTRGVAAAEGWTVIDIYGPKGNKYLNACPEHRASEIKKKLDEAFVSATGK